MELDNQRPHASDCFPLMCVQAGRQTGRSSVTGLTPGQVDGGRQPENCQLQTYRNAAAPQRLMHASQTEALSSQPNDRQPWRDDLPSTSADLESVQYVQLVADGRDRLIDPQILTTQGTDSRSSISIDDHVLDPRRSELRQTTPVAEGGCSSSCERRSSCERPGHDLLTTATDRGRRVLRAMISPARGVRPPRRPPSPGLHGVRLIIGSDAAVSTRDNLLGSRGLAGANLGRQQSVSD